MEVVVETKRLLSLFRTVSMDGLAEKALIHFDKNGVSTINPSIGRQMLVRAWFSKNFFINYNTNEQLDVGINCNLVNSVLKAVKSSKVSLTADDSNLYIKGMSEDKVIEDIKVPLTVVEPEQIPMEFRDAPFGEVAIKRTNSEEEAKALMEEFLQCYSYTKIPVLPSTQLDPLKMEKVAFEIKNGRLILRQENEVGVGFGRVISEFVNNPKDGLRVVIGTAYLKKVMRSVLSGELYVAVGQKDGQPLPLIFCDKTSDWKITLPVAPRIEEIEESEE